MGTAEADYEIGAACLIPHSLLWFPCLLLWCRCLDRYQLIVAPVKAMSALAAAAPVVVVAVVANSISGVDSDIYIVMITMTGPCREDCTVSI